MAAPLARVFCSEMVRLVREGSPPTQGSVWFILNRLSTYEQPVTFSTCTQPLTRGNPDHCEIEEPLDWRIACYGSQTVHKA